MWLWFGYQVELEMLDLELVEVHTGLPTRAVALTSPGSTDVRSDQSIMKGRKYTTRNLYSRRIYYKFMFK